MKAEKDPKTGKWLIQYRYTDWQGIRKKSTKRGFATKREAEEWLRTFLMSQQADFNMNFEEFLKLYYEDMAPRIRENTLRTKKYIIDLKILPFFGKKSINSIKPADVRRWQNELIAKGYSYTYLRTVNNQLTAVFNYAVKYYDLKN
ncbi:Arm DNA-binding domain-containing protein, partial [Anaerotignum propionicum]|uniref:Arm DNA-binding domain-containing protein n=1 Tax=Anaerotignum propionicum TaxID=28446 RepID=UPI00289EAA94